MTRASPYQPSGNAGELSPRLHARTDFTKYGAGWETCENIIPLPEGAMMRRAGTRYVHELADSSAHAILRPFNFSNEQAYVLVFENEAFYFNRHQGQILVANTDAAITNGDFATDLTGWDDRSTGATSIAFGTVQRVIDRTLGTNIGNMTALGGLAAAFDGTTNQANTACAARSAQGGTVGKNWGAGNTKTVTGFAVHGSNNFGYGSDPTNVTLTLQGSSDNFSSDVNNLGSIGPFTDLADESAARSLLTGLVEAPYQYHRVNITVTSSSTYCAEVVLYDDDPAPLDGCQLVGDGSDIAWAEQDVTTTATDVEHVLAFRVNGDHGDTLQLSIGTTSTGGELISDVEYGVGFHVVAFTPTVSPFYIQFKNPNNYTIAVDDVALLDNEALKLTTPYPTADLHALTPAQSADTMYLFHQDYPTYKLLRFGHTSWSLQRVAWEDGPYLTQNTTETTATPAAVTGRDIVVTFSSAVGINNDTGFSDDDVGRALRIDNPASGVDWGWGVITSVTSSVVVEVAIQRDFAATTADKNWRLGAWSDESGWPKTGLFYEQRLFIGASATQPQTLWASQTADFENLAPDSPTDAGVWDGTVQDDDALSYTISANEVNAIVAMAASDDAMIIMTSGGEWRPQSNGAVLTPTDITVRRQTSHGSADNILPLSIDNVVLFVQRGLRKIREFGFSFEADGYRAFDMTRLAQHITFSDIHEMAFAEEPDSQVYVVREDGQLLSMTFRREEDVVGWTRHILGGSFGAGDAVVESVAVISGANGAGQVHDSTNRNEVWLIVKRTIDSATVRYVEFLERDHEKGHDQEDAFYVDSGLTYDGAAATTITGFGHLEGETVKVWADGKEIADKTVSSGQFVLASAASVVQAGLGYTHKLKTLKPEAGSASGTAVTKTKRFVRVGFVVNETVKMSYGPAATGLIETSFDVAAGGTFYTGEWFVDWEDDWKRDPRIFIQGDSPSPFTLLAIAPEIDTKDLY